MMPRWLQIVIASVGSAVAIAGCAFLSLGGHLGGAVTAIVGVVMFLTGAFYDRIQGMRLDLSRGRAAIQLFDRSEIPKEVLNASGVSSADFVVVSTKRVAKAYKSRAMQFPGIVHELWAAIDARAGLVLEDGGRTCRLTSVSSGDVAIYRTLSESEAAKENVDERNAYLLVELSVIEGLL